MSAVIRDDQSPELELLRPVEPAHAEILSSDALRFVAALHARCNPIRLQLLAAREAQQTRFDAGELPSFPTETESVRRNDWTVAAIPEELHDRRVEITGPVDRKMIINALNSDAKVFMADFEDSSSPTFENMIDGQINLRDANQRTISLEANGKHYALGDDPAVLMVRPRGWHLPEKHARVGGELVSGSLFDFGLYIFHNAKILLGRGSAPYFYLPKLEHYLEARLWADAFRFAEDALGLPRGTIKATVLIETLPAAFQMDEIIYELRDYLAGLNCGRWDYIFSYIKVFRNHANRVTPDRGQITMGVDFLRAYSQRLIAVCHRRGAFAMGGMAAQIPIKQDPQANEAALEKVRLDKQREARNGHDGTWVAHPGLIPTALAEFDAVLTGPNQLTVKPDPDAISEPDLIVHPQGTITREGLEDNVMVAIRYLAAWLAGNGCVPIDNLMEDAATAEISRSQLWQWVHHPAQLDDGSHIDLSLVLAARDKTLDTLREGLGDDAFASGGYAQAADLLTDLVQAEVLTDFLTLPGYQRLG